MQERSHPLEWKFLVHCVERSGLENPDVWIEDCRRYGRCGHDFDDEEEPTVFCEGTSDETDAIQASFSVMTFKNQNLIVIRHHY